ncbi:hypothetical protein SY88_18350 [Clostridiales bacterium PH28_bin88]|nr:hypothetical protein SY88_18350 [Clostridiales bacterium PH28_bin88]
MLQALVLTLSGGFEPALAVALLAAYLQQIGRTESMARVRQGVAAGVLASLGAAAALQWFGGREAYEGVAFSVISLVEVALLAWLWVGKGKEEGRVKADVLALLGAMAIVLAKGVDLVLFPTRLFIQTTDYLNTELLLKTSGGVLGVVFALVLGLALVRTAALLTPRLVRGLATAAWLSMVMRQAVVVVQVLLVNGVLPMDDTLLGIVIPLINHQGWFFNWLLGVAAVMVLWTAVQGLRRGELPTGDLNPAQLRKLKAAARREVRLVSVAGILMIAAVSLVLTNAAYASRTVELSPAQPVAAVNGEVQIPVESVSDGQLHRFGYSAADGTEVRFIVVQKGGSSFGVGLDACDICGPTGYYQRGDQVICKNCDVVINRATIGFRGGCNPVPLEYQLEGGSLVLPADQLETEKERFQE